MYLLRIITYALVIIGALNWGLVGMFGFDLIAAIFGDMSVMSRIIYSLAGLSAAVLLVINRGIFSETCECR